MSICENRRSNAFLLVLLLGQSPATVMATVQELVPSGVSSLVTGVPTLGDPTLLWTTAPDCSNVPGDELLPALINRASLAIATPRAVFAFNPQRPVARCNPHRFLSNVFSFGADLYYIDNEGPEGHAALWRRPRNANAVDPSQLLADLGRGITGAEIVVFGVSVVAILGTSNPLVQPNLMAQYHKDTGELLNGRIDFGGVNALGKLRYDGRYLYWLKDGALRRNDTTNGVLETVLDGPIDSLYTYGYEEQCGPEGCVEYSRILFGQDNGLFESETISGDVFRVYTSPVPSARITDIERGPTHYYFIERRPVGGFDREDRFFRLGVGNSVPDLIYGPVNNGGPGFEGLRTDYTWLYFRDRRTEKLLRLSNFAAAIPVRDLRATGLEITQGLQNSANALRLIENKRTVVRFYVSSQTGENVPGVTAQLSGWNAQGFLGTLEPVNALGKLLTVRANPTRSNLDHSFQFELPRHWTNGGELTLTATVNPARRVVEDNFANNSSVAGGILFWPSPRLLVIYYNWAYDLGGARHTPAAADVAASRRHMKRLYPLGEPGNAFESRGLHTVVLDFVDNELADQVDRTDDACIKRYKKAEDREMCASDYVHGRMTALRRGSGIAADAVSYGNIAQAPAPMELSYFTRGYANGQIASGPSTDANYASHEVGHVLQRAHPGLGLACGHSLTDQNYPYALSLIENLGVDVARRYAGLDFADRLPGRMTFLDGSTYYDTMSYCSPNWISDYTFEGMYEFLVSDRRPRAAGAAQPRATSGDWLIVTGTLSPEKGEGGFVFVQRVSSVMDATPPAAGGFALELRNAVGDLLAIHPFTANPVDDDPGKLVFDLVVEFAPETAELRAVDETTGQTLATLTVSPNAPVVSEIRLPGAPDPVDGVVSVTWNADDPDGDELRFDIFASRDGGRSYRPIYLGVEGGGGILDATMLGGGTNQLRVVASDGVHTAVAESAPFNVPPRPPKVTITSPVDGFHAEWGQIVSLQVEVDDLQDAFIPDERIIWTEVRTGIVGTGRWVQVNELPVGKNVLEVTVTNGLGASSTAAVTVMIGDRLSVPGPTLSIAPQTIAWHVAEDDLSTQFATLSVENAGEGTLQFNVRSDASWLSLDSAGLWAGVSAPRVFTLTADPARVRAGTTGEVSLVFENADDPNDVVVVPVQLSRGNVFDRTGAEPLRRCTGDCDGNGIVSVDELVRGVNVALGVVPLGRCVNLDANTDGRIAIDELTFAVTRALIGC